MHEKCRLGMNTYGLTAVMSGFQFLYGVYLLPLLLAHVRIAVTLIAYSPWLPQMDESAHVTPRLLYWPTVPFEYSLLHQQPALWWRSVTV